MSEATPKKYFLFALIPFALFILGYWVLIEAYFQPVPIIDTYDFATLKFQTVSGLEAEKRYWVYLSFFIFMAACVIGIFTSIYIAFIKQQTWNNLGIFLLGLFVLGGIIIGVLEVKFDKKTGEIKDFPHSERFYKDFGENVFSSTVISYRTIKSEVEKWREECCKKTCSVSEKQKNSSCGIDQQKDKKKETAKEKQKAGKKKPVTPVSVTASSKDALKKFKATCPKKSVYDKCKPPPKAGNTFPDLDWIIMFGNIGSTVAAVFILLGVCTLIPTINGTELKRNKDHLDEMTKALSGLGAKPEKIAYTDDKAIVDEAAFKKALEEYNNAVQAKDKANHIFETVLAKPVNELATRIQDLKILLFAGAAVLVTGVLLMKAWREWPMAFFANSSTEQMSYQKLVEASVQYEATLYSLVLLAIFAPIALKLRSRSQEVSEIVKPEGTAVQRETWRKSKGIALKFGQQLQNLIAILSPFLAPSVLELIKKIPMGGIAG